MLALAAAGVVVLSFIALSTTDIGRSPTDFRYAIDEGVERRLYLSGGTREGPDEIRLLRNDSLVAEHETVLLGPGIIDVCHNNPPQDRRWWQATIDEALAAAIRRGDTSAYRLEALVDGEWRPIRPRHSGCKWKGG